MVTWGKAFSSALKIIIYSMPFLIVGGFFIGYFLNFFSLGNYQFITRYPLNAFLYFTPLIWGAFLITWGVLGVSLKIIFEMMDNDVGHATTKAPRGEKNQLTALEQYITKKGRIEFSAASINLAIDEKKVRVLLDKLLKDGRVKGYILSNNSGFMTEESALDEARGKLK